MMSSSRFVLLFGFSLVILHNRDLVAQCPSLCDTTNTFFGIESGVSISTGIANSFFGDSTGMKNNTGSQNSFFGGSSGANNLTGNRNSFFGNLSGYNTNTGGGNAFFGEATGYNNTSGAANSFFGTGTGYANKTGSFNCFYGWASGVSNTLGGINAFYGSYAGRNNTTGNQNSFFGANSGRYNISGTGNSFFGNGSGTFNSTGSENSFFGTDSGFNNSTGKSNSFFGEDAGSKNIRGYGNSFFGTSSGYNAQGSNNVCVGRSAGATLGGLSSGNIVIGHQAGTPNLDTLMNRLFIDNESSDTPLIYGEFDNDHIVINGTFEVTAGLSNPSSRAVKTNYSTVDASDVLDKIAVMDIQEWNYIAHPGQRHIGPFAAEFHSAFGLGKDDSSISTIDASGVALVAIQALQQENNELKKLILDLTERVNSLENE